MPQRDPRLVALVEIVSERDALNEQQKTLLTKIYTSKQGQVLRKGKTERILYGADHMFIAYMTKRSKTQVTALNIPEFLKWAEKAEFVEKEES